MWNEEVLVGMSNWNRLKVNRWSIQCLKQSVVVWASYIPARHLNVDWVGGGCSFLDEQPEWSMYREASFGHGELDMVNATHARWTWHRNDDDEAVVADDIWITSLSAPESQCSVSSSTKTRVSNRRVLRPLGT